MPAIRADLDTGPKVTANLRTTVSQAKCRGIRYGLGYLAVGKYLSIVAVGACASSEPTLAAWRTILRFVGHHRGCTKVIWDKTVKMRFLRIVAINGWSEKATSRSQLITPSLGYDVLGAGIYQHSRIVLYLVGRFLLS